MRETRKITQHETVTLEDVAARCGVSKVTVSRALHGQTSKVSKAKASEIRTVAAELGYELGSNHAARQMVLRRHHQSLLNRLIAVFMPLAAFDAPYFMTIYRGIVEVMREERFGMLMHYTDIEDSEHDLLPFFARGEVDGVLTLANPQLWSPILASLRRTAGFGARPIVSMIHPMDGCASVTTDDRRGGYAALTHLLQLGHRRVLHFCHDLRSDVHLQRYMGYTQACLEIGLAPDDVLCTSGWVYIDEYRDQALALLQSALDKQPDITAILAPNDVGAGWIYTYLTQQGRRIPDEISLIGFDDSDPILDDHGKNILSTVQLPLREIGAEAARLVIRLVHGQTSPEQGVVLSSHLLLRSTTTPHRR